MVNALRWCLLPYCYYPLGMVTTQYISVPLAIHGSFYGPIDGSYRFPALARICVYNSFNSIAFDIGVSAQLCRRYIHMRLSSHHVPMPATIRN